METLCFSIYSDISTRIRAFSVPNIASASALQSSVFPTPVGPRNKKEPIGRFGSFNPTLPRRIAFATATTASSCPTTRSWRMDSSFKRRSVSPSASLLTGIFVHPEITSAMSFSSTVSCLLSFSLSHFSFILRIFSRFEACFFLISPASSYASLRIASSFSFSSFLMSSSSVLMPFGST